ncbi:MAG: hypothetical protein ACFBSF_21705, partial [Leptolyngbyaceae cyanobacterium]
TTHRHYLAQGSRQKHPRFPDSCLLGSTNWKRAPFFAPTTATLGTVTFNLMKQVNTWYFVQTLQAYELKINQILEKDESTNVFHFYRGLSESRYLNGVYRTTYLFFLLYVRLAVMVFPLAVLSLINVIYALAFLAFSLLNTGTLLLVAKRAYRYYPGKDLVGFKYLITHLLCQGPID